MTITLPSGKTVTIQGGGNGGQHLGVVNACEEKGPRKSASGHTSGARCLEIHSPCTGALRAKASHQRARRGNVAVYGTKQKIRTKPMRAEGRET